MIRNECKHWKPLPLLMHNGFECKKGIKIKEITNDPKWFSKCPCLYHNESSVNCEHREFYTDEELEIKSKEQEEEFKKILDAEEKIRPYINDFKKANRNGTCDCPICDNKIVIHISPYNGHASAKCKTQNCFFMME